jgi:hypothetical protein
MNKTVLFAPQIDAIIEGFNPENNPMTCGTLLKLKDIYNAFSYVKSGNDDEIRHTWIEVERGPVEAFGDYEEFKESGEVESPEEFEKLWKEYYHEEINWYIFKTSKFRDEKFFYLNGKLFGIIKEEDPPSNYNASVSGCFELFINWLQERILVEMSKLRQNPEAYNSYIQKNLSWTKRFGRIRRKDYWDILGDNAIRTDKNLGEETIKKIKAFVEAMKNERTPLLQEMTANMFFRICEICYDANDYFKNQKEAFTPRKKYLKMSDGRDAGLRNIDGDSPEAFYEWYHGAESMGAHPWEICRGGNSTHISLFISEVLNKWDIRLAGSSIVRVEETVRMAVALFENKIPFQLSDAEEIVRMVTGSDYIGIVPDTIFPRYCHNLFPGEDNIIDFMNLGFDKEIIPKIIEKTCWYPLEEITPD